MGCTIMDKIGSKDIGKELNIFNLNNRITQWRNERINHIHRMAQERFNYTESIRKALESTRKAFNYTPKAKRDRRRPILRWFDQ